MNTVGQPADRPDGPLKVCGTARYAGDFRLPGMAEAVLVQSTLPRGRILRIDRAGALDMPGVAAVMTHLDAPRLPSKGRAAKDRVLSLLQDDRVAYNGQPIAVVVADTRDQAVAAAREMVVEYRAETPMLDFEAARRSAYPPESVQGKEPDSERGDPAAGRRGAASYLRAVYSTPAEYHNPMEPHATVAAWENGRLTLYDSTQQVSGARKVVAATLGLDEDRVRVICPFVGGGFGGKGSVWSHVVLAAMAARELGRPVRLVLDRTQMYGPVGNRPAIEQTLELAARSDGALRMVGHDVLAETSTLEDWDESSALVTRMLYACDNLWTTHRLLRLDIGTPTFQRAPGESTGTYALESAMDELAWELNMDPIALRLRNHADVDPERGLPFSSKSLRECYRVGAERFGWAARDPRPRSMRRGGLLSGMGMATATYPAHRSRASARARLMPDGTALVQSGSQDLGTGTYAAMTQVAADALGLPLSQVRFELGDTELPKAPISGGSQTVASVAPAVRAAGLDIRRQLIELAIGDPRSPAHGVPAGQVRVEDGRIGRRGHAGGETVQALLARHGGRMLEANADVAPGDERKRYSMHGFGAVFAHVLVDPDLGEVRVPRIVGVYGVGRLVNEKTAINQLAGGIVWGLGMALTEAALRDPHDGRCVNGDLAQYHVPVNADVGGIEVLAVPEDDPHVNPLGAKGIGEIGITGVAAAIANAVHHATGRRVRALPITPDKLL